MGSHGGRVGLTCLVDKVGGFDGWFLGSVLGKEQGFNTVDSKEEVNCW